jgi:hypothetical protein
MAYDGSIRIDSRIDTSGYDSGVRKMESTAEKASSNIVNKFEDKWKAMDWGGKQAVIEKATATYGNAWDTMGVDEQHIALLKILGDLEKMPEPLEKEVNPALKKMNVYGHGFTRILNALVPGMYRMRRSVLGLNEMAVDMGEAAKSGVNLFSAIKALPMILTLAAIGVALLAKAAFNWAQKTVNQLYENLSITSAFRDKVVELKGAFDSVKGAMQALGASLLNAIAPVLLKIIDWLIKAINWVSMFIAALTGQKTVMQYVSGATDSAAGATGKLAKNTKDLKKAAEGALAAFDEINVLQMETADEGGGGAAGGNIVLQEVAVPTDFIKTSWEGFKTWFKEKIIDPIGNWFKEMYDGIGKWLMEKVFEPGGKWLAEAFTNITNPAWWQEKFAAVSQWASGIVQWIFDNIFDPIANFFKEKVIDPIVSGFTKAIEGIKTTFENLKITVQNVWSTVYGWFQTNVLDPIKNAFSITLGDIRGFFSAKWNDIKAIWGTAKTWFQTTVIDPIKNAFTTALDSIKTKWETIFGGIKTFVKGIINSIIDFLNGMLRGVATGINAVIGSINKLKITIPAWIPTYGGNSIGFNIPTVTATQIPRLATGAVIPPNAEFAAILGDNKKENEILAPEGLIRQIIQEELGSIKTDVEIKFSGSLGSLVRELKPYIDKENTRIGSSLVKGNA